MPPWSFHLYSARHFLPLARTLKLLAKWGDSQVEGYGDYGNPRQLRSVMDLLGLTMPTIHIDLITLRQSPDQEFQVSQRLGIVGANWSAAQSRSLATALHGAGLKTLAPEPATVAAMTIGLGCFARRHRK